MVVHWVNPKEGRPQPPEVKNVKTRRYRATGTLIFCLMGVSMGTISLGKYLAFVIKLNHHCVLDYQFHC